MHSSFLQLNARGVRTSSELNENDSALTLKHFKFDIFLPSCNQQPFSFKNAHPSVIDPEPCHEGEL